MLSREEFSEVIGKLIGQEASEENLSIVRDIMTTYDELSDNTALTAALAELEDTKKQLEDLRRDYILSFLKGKPVREVEDPPQEEPEENNNPTDYNLV